MGPQTEKQSVVSRRELDPKGTIMPDIAQPLSLNSPEHFSRGLSGGGRIHVDIAEGKLTSYVDLGSMGLRRPPRVDEIGETISVMLRETDRLSRKGEEHMPLYTPNDRAVGTGLNTMVTGLKDQAYRLCGVDFDSSSRTITLRPKSEGGREFKVLPNEFGTIIEVRETSAGGDLWRRATIDERNHMEYNRESGQYIWRGDVQDERPIRHQEHKHSQTIVEVQDSTGAWSHATAEELERMGLGQDSFSRRWADGVEDSRRIRTSIRKNPSMEVLVRGGPEGSWSPADDDQKQRVVGYLLDEAKKLPGDWGNPIRGAADMVRDDISSAEKKTEVVEGPSLLVRADLDEGYRSLKLFMRVGSGILATPVGLEFRMKASADSDEPGVFRLVADGRWEQTRQERDIHLVRDQVAHMHNTDKNNTLIAEMHRRLQSMSTAL